MTIEKFNELVRKDKEKRDAISAEINDLLRQESELDAAAEAAANAGNVEGYTKKLEEKNAVSVALFVKRRALDNLPKTDMKDEAEDAWKDYVREYNKKLKKALADFKAEKAKFLKMYSDLVDLQREALTTRRQIASIAEADENLFQMEFIPCRNGMDVNGMLTLPGFNCKDADAAYYLADHAIRHNISYVSGRQLGRRDPEEARIACVVVAHNPDIIM